MSTPKDVYTFDDLRSWAQITGGIQPAPRLSVFGDPVAHSLSPQMHNPGLLEAGIDAQYVRLHILPSQLKEALQELKTQNFIGTNLTIPHKAAAIEAMDTIDETALHIGVVNTVLVEDGQLIGFNSDGPRFCPGDPGRIFCRSTRLTHHDPRRRRRGWQSRGCSSRNGSLRTLGARQPYSGKNRRPSPLNLRLFSGMTGLSARWNDLRPSPGMNEPLPPKWIIST